VSTKNSLFETDIVLGERYRDTATGFVGTAVSIHFYEHACERVSLKGMNGQGEVLDYAFDAPELEHAETKIAPVVSKTGGPHDRKLVTR
jgi:hypothetical protein